MSIRYTLAGSKIHGNPYQPSERKPEHVNQWEAIKSRIQRNGPLTFEEIVAIIEPHVSQAQKKRGGATSMARYLIKTPQSGVAALIQAE